MAKLTKEVLSARRFAWALVVAKVFEVERATTGFVGSTGTKYTLITFVLSAFVVPRSCNNWSFVYFGIRYNCCFTISDSPFTFLTTLLKGIAFAPFSAEIVSLPKVVPTIFPLLISPLPTSTSLLAVLPTCTFPSYLDGPTISSILTPLLLW